MTPWLESMTAVALASALPLGATIVLSFRRHWLRDWLPRLVPFAVGALLGAAMLHLVPEAVAGAAKPLHVLGTVALGAATFFLLDRALHARYGSALARDGSALAGGLAPLAAGHHPVPLPNAERERLRALLPLNIAGDAVHNVIDGMLIAASFLDNPSLGIITGAAIAVHEFPRELGTFALCVRGGMPVRRAILINAATAALALLGAALTLLLGTRVAALGGQLLPFAAGNFLFLALSILLAEIRDVRGGRDAMRLAGLVVLGFLLTALPGHH